MSERLTLQDLVDLLSEKQGITKKEADTFIRELIDLITETIEQKDSVKIKDFGTFKPTPIKARKSVDVNTGESIEIPAHYRLTFTPDKVLRDIVNQPFAHLPTVLLNEKVVFEDVDDADEKDDTDDDSLDVEAEIDLTEKQEPKVAVVEKEEDKSLTDILQEVREKVESKKEEEIKAAPKETKTKITPAAPTISEKKKEIEERVKTEEIIQEEAKPVEKKEERKEPASVAIEQSVYEEKKSYKMWIGIVAILLVLLIGGYWIFSKGDSATTSTTAKAEDKKEEVVIQEIDQPEQAEQEVEPEPSRIEVVKEGDSMRKLGKRCYGNDVFWVYIFQENRELLKNPHNLLIGLKLTVAPPSKYNIDPNDAASIERATTLENSLFTEFGYGN